LLVNFERNLNSFKDLLKQLEEASKEDKLKVRDSKMKWKSSVFLRLVQAKPFVFLNRFW